MSFDDTPPTPDEPAPPPPPPQRTSLFMIFGAWVVILGLVFLIVRRQFVEQPAPPQDGDAAAQLPSLLITIQGKAIVAYMNLLDTAIKNDPNNPDLNPQKIREEVAKDLASLEARTVEQRLGVVILRGEILGPDAALEWLNALRDQIAAANHPLEQEQEEVLELLTRLYRDGPKAKETVLKPEEQQVLHDRLGWFGDLAVTSDEEVPAGLRDEVLRSAQKVLVTIGVLLGFLILVGLAGVIGLGVFVIGMLVGGVRSRVATGNGGGVYAETFALWMAVFLGLNFLIGHFAPPRTELLLHIAAFFGSLLTLAWPVLRGVPWRQVREDIGWTRPPGGVLEPFVGLACYAMSLPLLAVGVIGFLILSAIAAQAMPAAPVGDGFEPKSLPAHPIVGELAQGGWWTAAQILFLGVVAAPIVEETMFRGVLYRHLREGSRWLGTFFSAFFSGTVVSFLFAVIHPQGILAVPLLMAMAFGFTIAREWRGSLVAAMVAHGLTNLVTMVLVLNLFQP